MINRVVCKALMLTDWNNHGNISTARVCICDNVKKDNADRSVFIKVKAFSKTAELLEKYTAKGDILFIDGRLDMESYETKEGKKRYEYSIVIDKVEWNYKDKKDNDKPQNEEDVPF